VEKKEAEKRLLFESIMGAYGLYVEEHIDWEALVEKLLGLTEEYREHRPVTKIGRKVGDKIGHWKDGGVRT